LIDHDADSGCVDHIKVSAPYFSVHEAQTFDAIVRNDDGAIEGMPHFTTFRD
jgi:hypothetical protein